MSKKRRFKRKTLGRLQMFFGKNPYTGNTGSQKAYMDSNTTYVPNVLSPQQIHYKNVTKKNIYHPNHQICKYYTFGR